MSKTCVIFHSQDLDGWMSAAIVKHWFNKQESDNEQLSRIEGQQEISINTIEFIGYNYGQPIPDLSEYDKVIMCDISFPKEEMLNLWTTKGLNFEWIDHHISAIKIMENAHENISSGAYPIQGLRDTKFAACELTWQYFFPNDPMPEIVRLLGRYDCFGSKGTDEHMKVLEFQYGARQLISDYKEAYSWLITSINSITNKESSVAKGNIDFIHNKGISIYQYLCTEAKQAYKNGFTVKFRYSEEDLVKFDSLFKQVRFICINKERFNPINFGIDYHKDGYDGCACFWYANKMWNFSLYNDNGLVDCSIIAKQFGGGGHKGAAGFQINDINELLKKS